MYIYYFLFCFTFSKPLNTFVVKVKSVSLVYTAKDPRRACPPLLKKILEETLNSCQIQSAILLKDVTLGCKNGFTMMTKDPHY